METKKESGCLVGCCITVCIILAIIGALVLGIGIWADSITSAPKLLSTNYENKLLSSDIIEIEVKANDDYEYITLLIEFMNDSEVIVNTKTLTKKDLRDGQTYRIEYAPTSSELHGATKYVVSIQDYKRK